MCKELRVELLLPEDENNKDGNTYFYVMTERDGKKYNWELAQKETKLGFAKHA
jgi:hypothetical protein